MQSDKVRHAVECMFGKLRLFPSNHSAMKAVFLAIERTAKKWSVPIRD
ncbi:MAG: hypothetical protein M0R47_17730 [Methylobacter sp.]|nr:hypothetical protein [Methylobacter sp.]MCK9622365.1 hypothetical protein [Methylobacter sp.]